MKRFAIALAALLLLAGCTDARERSVEELLAPYETMESCTMTAELSCEYETQRREYTLRCAYVPQGVSTVSVLEPEQLCGVTALVGGEETRLQYEDLLLDAPLLGSSRLSAAEILPRLIDAMREGWLLEESSLYREETALRQIVFETEGGEEKLYWTVWLNEDSGALTAAEVTEGEQLFFTMEFTDFAFGAILFDESAS